MLAIFLIPAGLCFACGRIVCDMRQGWAVLGAMTVSFVLMTVVVMMAEQQAHPALQALGVDQGMSALQSGGKTTDFREALDLLEGATNLEPYRIDGRKIIREFEE